MVGFGVYWYMKRERETDDDVYKSDRHLSEYEYEMGPAGEFKKIKTATELK